MNVCVLGARSPFVKELFASLRNWGRAWRDSLSIWHLKTQVEHARWFLISTSFFMPVHALNTNIRAVFTDNVADSCHRTLAPLGRQFVFRV